MIISGFRLVLANLFSGRHSLTSLEEKGSKKAKLRPWEGYVVSGASGGLTGTLLSLLSRKPLYLTICIFLSVLFLLSSFFFHQTIRLSLCRDWRDNLHCTHKTCLGGSVSMVTGTGVSGVLVGVVGQMLYMMLDRWRVRKGVQRHYPELVPPRKEWSLVRTDTW